MSEAALESKPEKRIAMPPQEIMTPGSEPAETDADQKERDALQEEIEQETAAQQAASIKEPLESAQEASADPVAEAHAEDMEDKMGGSFLERLKNRFFH